MASDAPPPTPTGLRCDLLVDAARGAVSVSPRFGWLLTGVARQRAYQVRVCRDSRLVWDSGCVESAASVAVPCSGATLSPNTDYEWSVRVWGTAAAPSAWSDAQRFRTGESGSCRAAREPVAAIDRVAVAPPRRDGSVWCFDFGTAAFGTLVVDVPVTMTGRRVKLWLGEHARDGRINRAPVGSVRCESIDVSLPDVPGLFSPRLPSPARHGRPPAVPMPPGTGPVIPFRYAEVEGWVDPPAHNAFRQRASWIAGDGDVASFRCDDESLERVWGLCAHTVRATTFCGLYVDGDRERTVYEGDAYVQQLSHYALERVHGTARATIEYLLSHPTWPTEWQLHMPIMAWLDYLQTGDDNGIRCWYDRLALRALCDLDRGDGLLDSRRCTTELLERLGLTRMEDMVDWPPASFAREGTGERDNHEMRPVNSVVNALHVLACRHLGWIASALGRVRDAADWEARAERTAAMINRHLFDEAAGAYVDGEGSSHHSLHSSVYALAAAVVPAAQITRVADFVSSRGMACSVFGAQWLLEALFRCGRDREALALMTATHDRSWCHMIEYGATTTWEAWDHRYKKNLDWTHGWATAPINIVARFVMGVEVIEPGAARLRVRPQPASLQWFAGRVPTARGFVDVTMTRAQEGEVRLVVDLPANVEAEVAVPRPGSSRPRLILDGREIPHRVDRGWLTGACVGPGRHELVARPG